MIAETNTPTEGGKYEQLRWLTDVYGQYQKHRIALGNRMYASAEGLDTNEPTSYMVRSFEYLEALEKDTFREMKRVVKHHPAWPWLDAVKGMGPTLSTKILGLIGDVSKFDTVSKLWAFSGYGLKNGANGVPERQRPVKGEKLSYNRRLKTAVYLAGDSFIKSRSPYRDFYDDAKARYRLTKQAQPLSVASGVALDDLPDRDTTEGKKDLDAMIKAANSAAGEEVVWSDGHNDNAARRVMVKVFLSHLWEVWREAEGLAVRPDYAAEYLGHTTRTDPWTFTK
jgi:hypothetical protein